MLKGITVVLTVKTAGQTTDEFGVPTYTETTVNVDNVLVMPTSDTDVITQTDLNGKSSKYTLCIPKGDTHAWTDTKVSFWGETWRTVGNPTEYIESMLPLSWNKKVQVERYE